MADTILSDKDASIIKAEANQASSDPKENGTNGTSNGTTNGSALKDNEEPAPSNGSTTSASSAIEPVAGPSSGETKSMEAVNLAMQHFAAGKRDLLISDPNAAVASLAIACELLGTHYGEMASECGESYYYYGRALLELARLEAGVIENLDGDNESEENSAEEEEAQQESPETPEEGGSVEGEEGSVEGEKEKEENETIGSEDKEVNAVQDQGDVKEVEKEEEEDPSNLQLAWEMLELAKTILVKQAESIKIVNAEDNKDAEEKAKLKEDVENRVSDTFQTLGELSIENENYPQAIEDLETCLQRRQQMMPEDTRCIAETHYQLGVAQGFNLQFDEAVTSLEGAINVLQIRIDKLKTKTESIDPSKARDAFYTRENEIKEIESLIPEIREKILDTKDMKSETFKKLGDKRLMEEGMAAAFGSAESGSLNRGASSSKMVSTISSSLIKKRPAPTDSVTTEAKKVHLEPSAAPNTSTENGATKNGM